MFLDDADSLHITTQYLLLESSRVRRDDNILNERGM